MRAYELTALVWKEEGGYVSKCPELEIASCGDSISEARINLKNVFELFLENAKIVGMMDDIMDSLSTEDKYTAIPEVNA